MVAEFAEFSDEFAELAVKMAGKIQEAKSRAASRKSSLHKEAVSAGRGALGCIGIAPRYVSLCVVFRVCLRACMHNRKCVCV